MEGPPRVTAPTSQMIATSGAQAGLPPLGRDGRPEIVDESAGSMRVPVSRGARMATIAIVATLDAAMAITGVVLLMRGWSSGEVAAVAVADAAAAPVATVDAGVIVEIVPDAKVAEPGPGPASGPAPAPGPAPTTGTGGSKGGGRRVIDAGVPVVRPPDAAIPVVRPPDAAPAPVPAADAAPPAPAPDAAAAPAPDAATGAGLEDDVVDQVAVHLRRSNDRLSRCYTQATKGLPDDQPLEGEVDIAFEVVPTGETRNVAVSRNTTESNQLGACIVDVVAAWSFTPFQGEPVHLQRTFRFRPRT